MRQRTLVDSPPLVVEPAWALGARNPLTEHPSVRALAILLVDDPPLLQCFAVFVVTIGNKKGYLQTQMDDAKRRIQLLAVVPAQRRRMVIKALSELGVAYSEWLRTETEAERSKLPGRTSAAVLEAVIITLLTKCERQADDLVPDAHFTVAGETSSRNVDVVWVLERVNRLEMYECKIHPDRLLAPYFKRSWMGHESEWKKSKLYMMLEVQSILTKHHWNVRLFLATLHSHGFVDAYLANQGSPPPPLEFCPVEALRIPFPPDPGVDPCVCEQYIDPYPTRPRA
jgi:hypothetical protein